MTFYIWLFNWHSNPYIRFYCCSVAKLFDSLTLHELQHVRLPCPSPTPGACSNSCPSVMPSNYLILCRPFILLPSIFPSIRVFANESVLRIRWPKYWSYSISSSMNIQDWFHLELTVWSPCCPRDSQESFPTPQFESISSLANSSYYRKQSFSGSGVPGVYIRVEGASTNTPKLMSRLITVFLLV